MFRRGLFVILFLFGPTAAMADPAGDGEIVTPLSRSKESVRVAVAQMQIDPSSLEPGQDTVDALVPWMKRGADAKADLLVFPEYLLGSFRMQGEHGKHGELIERLCVKAKEYDLNLIVGGWEHFPGHAIQHPPAPGTYANTVLVIGRDGKLAGKHRKMHAAVAPRSPYCWPPEAGEQGENTMVLGMKNGVVDLDFGRIGLLTCYDGYFFESFQMPSLRGAEVLVWVNSRGGMVEPHIIQAASFITCTHVVASNQSVGCGSAICSYPGWALQHAAPEPGTEAFLVGDLDLKELRAQRLNNRMFHQRRPEIYQPLVEPWKPWRAYPDLKPFDYESAVADRP